jgi:Predicted integral membrane protein (DUF2269)
VPIWMLVHILGMFAAFGLLLVPLVLLVGVARSADLHAAKAIYTAAKVLSRLAFGFFFIGLAGGFATMVTGGWSGTSPWLVLTYALLVLIAALDGILMGPWRQRVERAFASTAPGSAPPAELQPLLSGPQPVLYGWTTTLALVAIVSLMVLKPSFGA